MTPPASPDLSNYTINSLFSFKATGLDFAGLLYVRTSQEDAVLKVYILLLTCANSWGIHLELTPGMEVPSFIRGFKRFMLRIGIPDVVVSDNFKSFQSNEFTLQHQIIQKFMTGGRLGERNSKFKFPVELWVILGWKKVRRR